jgi:hypothetical protein
MNTPDQAPKDGDFVAFVAELERRQLLANPPASHASATASMNRAPAVTPTGPATTPASLAAAAGAIKTFPLGSLVIGIVLLIAGLAFDGGIFVAAIGVFFLWQAARGILKAARVLADANKSQAAQQVATLLSAHAQRNKPPAK